MIKEERLSSMMSVVSVEPITEYHEKQLAVGICK